jgi:hypothetical protein
MECGFIVDGLGFADEVEELEELLTFGFFGASVFGGGWVEGEGGGGEAGGGGGGLVFGPVEGDTAESELMNEERLLGGGGRVG